jgi:Papain family cysteine protease
MADADIDHRGRQTPVRQQGSRPTCVAFAVSAAHEWTSGAVTVRSAEHAFALAKVHDGLPAIQVGTTVQRCLVGISDAGQSPETDWPYGDPAWPDRRPESDLAPARRARPGPWRRLGAPWLAAIGTALRDGHAVVLTVGFVQRAWQHATAGGVIEVPPSPVLAGAHAVLVVGVQHAPASVLVIKNSWGARWGDAGYGYLTAEYLNLYAMDAHLLEAA